jgi:hypothetical protein
MGVPVAEYPADAVDVDDDRQGGGGALGADDPDRHLAGGTARDDEVTQVHRGLGHWPALDLLDEGPARRRAQV